MKHKAFSAKLRSASSGTEQFLGSMPFAQVVRPQKRLGHYAYRIFIEIVHDFFVLLTVALILWAPINWGFSAQREANMAVKATQSMAKWPQGQVARSYHAVQAYNRKIAASGQFRLGEVRDPFAKSNSSDDNSGSAQDKEYQSLLDGGNGVMGTIRVPKVSIRLPIYHGTSPDTLASGVGHLYGTSLPVGGRSSNSVLTGHRGFANAVLFTRLDQLDIGDAFYIQTLNRTMGYKVKAIHVIEPEDTRFYKVVPGKDLVTLMTCTPYGVNTQRLVITGERARIPQEVPQIGSKKDGELIGAVVAAVVLLLGLAWVLRRNYRVLVPMPLHYDGSVVPRRVPLFRGLDNRGLPPLGAIPSRSQWRKHHRDVD
ncbi:class C sortase [Bifidobacterium sp. ESL0704]|uniref:class C sortase n=1 Tax=Bifidobacterium sp. ESL0704 TaxID=2983219 RepID=UPI0023F834CD|nr:class C sortase [Bifidobacterium sp. ESL0704]WEV52929.1 class C sortase [Bifidobacterium sp. ESL0704]